jgi:putative hemolysin
MIKVFTGIFASFCFLLAGCSSHNKVADVPQHGTSVNISHHAMMNDSASANCSLAGGQVRLSPQLDGSAISVCQLGNGRQCSEAALARGACIGG